MAKWGATALSVILILWSGPGGAQEWVAKGPNDQTLLCHEVQSSAGGGIQLACRQPEAPPDEVAAPVVNKASPPAVIADPPPRWRVSAGGGYGVGDESGFFRVKSGGVTLKSITGGAGNDLMVNGWWDGALGSDFGLGVEYLRVRNTASAYLSLPKGLSILTDPTNGQVKLAAAADLAFLDLEYRPSLGSERFSAFLAAGPGIGWGNVRGNFYIFNPATGPYEKDVESHSIIGGIQTMMGAEFLITRRLYFSLSHQIFYTSGSVVGVHQSYLNMMLTGAIGVSFP